MDLLKLIQSAGGTESVDKLARTVGLGSGDAGSMIEALGPALLGGLRKNTTGDGGLAGLQRALQTGNHQRYVENPDLLADPATRADGNGILGHVFGNKDVSRNVAAHAARETGISADLIKQALPLVAGLAMGAMSKKTAGGEDLEPAEGAGGLGALGELLGGGDDGFGVDDVLNLAKRFF